VIDGFTVYTPGIKEQSYNGSLNTFGWNGKSQYQKDRESGLMLLGHRYYDQSTGRFLSEDPSGRRRQLVRVLRQQPAHGGGPERTFRKGFHRRIQRRSYLARDETHRLMPFLTDWPPEPRTIQNW